MAIRVAGLVAMVAAVTPEIHLNRPGGNVLGIVLLLVAVAAWVGWMLLRNHGNIPGVAVSLLVLGAAGGAMAPTATTAIAFAAVVGVGASMAFTLPLAVCVVAVDPVAHLISAAAHGTGFLPVLGSAAAALGGLIIGVSRVQTVATAEQRALVEVEHARAELLSERNRLAREIHDVLAHTLGAVSVQIEALDAVLDREDHEQLHSRLQATRGLVVQGLDEARRAVAALRDDAPPLAAQLEELVAGTGTKLVTEGDLRPLTPPTSLALFRIAQEALTNAAKHAPGAPVSMALRFTPGAVALEVVNGHPTSDPSPLAAHGGGYGLQGMRERVLMLGGTLEAEPDDGGWRVTATLPA